MLVETAGLIGGKIETEEIRTEAVDMNEIEMDQIGMNCIEQEKKRQHPNSSHNIPKEGKNNVLFTMLLT